MMDDIDLHVIILQLNFINKGEKIMSIKECKINLNEDYIELDIEKNTTKINKLISYEEFSKLFSSTNTFDSGLLPGPFGVRYIKETSDGKTVYVYLEPAHEILYRFQEDDIYYEDYDDEEEIEEELLESATEYKSYTPILLWVVRMRGQRVIDTEVYAMKEPVFTGFEELYQVPFGNVYTSSQKVCWGHHNLIIERASQIQGISDTFFNSYENYDLSSDRIKEFNRLSVCKAYKPIDLDKKLSERLNNEEGFDKKKALEFIHNTLLNI